MANFSANYFIKDSTGFTKSARTELGRELESIGFKFYAPQIGGGGEGTKIVEQVIASLVLNDILFDIFIGIAANRLDKALSTVYKWVVENKPKKQQKWIVEVFIYTPLRGKGNCHYVRFKADKKYAKSEIEKLLKQL